MTETDLIASIEELIGDCIYDVINDGVKVQTYAAEVRQYAESIIEAVDAFRQAQPANRKAGEPSHHVEDVTRWPYGG